MVFSQHTHGLGEEIAVLDGILEDEFGSYGAEYYIKNLPGSSHAPSSAEGCTLLVKLRHIEPDDLERVVIDIRNATWHQALVERLKVLPLAAFATKNTAWVRWATATCFNPHRHYAGEEIFLLDGVFEDDFGRYPVGTRIRSPHMSMHKPFSVEGCTILVKTGHLIGAQPAARRNVRHNIRSNCRRLQQRLNRRHTHGRCRRPGHGVDGVCCVRHNTLHLLSFPFQPRTQQRVLCLCGQ